MNITPLEANFQWLFSSQMARNPKQRAGGALLGAKARRFQLLVRPDD